MNFIITSRGYQDIQDSFHGLTIRLPGEDESHSISQEIDLVIKFKVKEISSTLELTEGEKRFLEKKLSEFLHRTYLWVTLVMEVIRQRQGPLRAGVTRNKLEAVVDELPSTVEGAYTTILDRTTNKELAKKLLHFVVVARRASTV